MHGLVALINFVQILVGAFIRPRICCASIQCSLNTRTHCTLEHMKFYSHAIFFSLASIVIVVVTMYKRPTTQYRSLFALLSSFTFMIEIYAQAVGGMYEYSVVRSLFCALLYSLVNCVSMYVSDSRLLFDENVIWKVTVKISA